MHCLEMVKDYNIFFTVHFFKFCICTDRWHLDKCDLRHVLGLHKFMSTFIIVLTKIFFRSVGE